MVVLGVVGVHSYQWEKKILSSKLVQSNPADQ